MYKSVLISTGLHVFIIIFTLLSLPFIVKKPLDLPPIISVELIQIKDKTNIPFAPKAKKIIEKIKQDEKLVSEQAPPKKVNKIKPDAIPLPDQKVEKIKKIEEKQNPEIDDNKVKQVSEFEKKEIFNPNDIAALIDKSKENLAETNIKNKKITQSQDKSMDISALTLSEEDALKYKEYLFLKKEFSKESRQMEAQIKQIQRAA